MNIMKLIFIILIIVTLYFLYKRTVSLNENDTVNKLKDHMEHYNDISFNPDYVWLNRMNLMPWWNSTRFTRNSSWDIRGDVPIGNYYVGPWLQSPLI